MRRGPNPIDFADTKAVRRLARVLSLAIIAGAAAFAVGANMAASAGPKGPVPAKEHHLHTPFVIVAAGLVMIATFIGTRMHGFTGTIEERSRRTFLAHVSCLALSEAATFLGLVLVFMTGSWEVVLPAALGFAGLATSAIRGEVRFSNLVAEAESGA